MKKLLVFCLLACAGQAAGQALPLPVDSLTGKITYSGVVQVPQASQAELYSRAREWFAATFGSSKTVLEMDDRELGKLVGRAYAPFDFSSGFGPTVAMAMWRTVKIEVKSGRYRYTLDGFGMGGSAANPTQPRPIEGWLAEFHKTGKPLGKMATKMLTSVTDGIPETANAEIESLQKAMAKKAGGDF